jgi:nucleotidyltransferase substrate binding protein (TIGR01987 family)
MLDLQSLKKAVEALNIAFEIYDHNLLEQAMPEKTVLRDGVIQRFEFTFELSWKMLKRYLEEFGLEKVDSLNNRDLFRVGFEQGLLDDPEAWFHYLKMRNQSSHIYDAGKAAAVFDAARDFQQVAQELLNRLEAKVR